MKGIFLEYILPHIAEFVSLIFRAEQIKLQWFESNYNRQNEMSKISKQNVQKKRSDQVD